MTPDLRTAEPELLQHEALGPAAPGRPSAFPSRRTWVALLVAAGAWAVLGTGVGQRELVNPGGWPMVGRFLAASVRPETAPAFLRVTVDAALTTLSYAVLGTALSVVLGLTLGLVVSETWSRGGRGAGTRWLAARALLSLPRGVHEVVYGLFLVAVFGLDPVVGVLAIGIPYGAVTAKVYSELLDETSHRAFDALRVAGVGRLKCALYTLGPEARRDMVSYAFYRFECSLRAAAILGIIGAGGLGFQLALSFSSLRYREMWTLIYALVLLCGGADLWSSRLRRRDRFGGGSLLFITGLVLLGLWHLRLDLTSLWSPKARRLAGQIANAAWPPDLDASGLIRLARLGLETLHMSILATVLASSAAVLVALLSARRARGPAGHGVAAFCRLALLVCRAIPPPVGALLFLFVLFPGPLPGALALALYNFGILGRLMGEVVENADARPSAGLLASGASRPQALLYATLPAVLPRFVAYSVYRWEVTLRETVVVGLVGAGGLGRLLSAQLTAFDYAGMLTTLAALVLLTFLGDLVGAAARRSLH